MDRHLVEWNGKRGFTATTPDGRTGVFDLPVDAGGDGTATTPMEAVLHAVAACTAVDLVAILGKMRLPPAGLRIEIAGERAVDHPRVFTHVHMVFILRGDLPEAKVTRAVELSAGKYCSVGAMVGRTAEITHEVRIES